MQKKKRANLVMNNLTFSSCSYVGVEPTTFTDKNKRNIL
jgi:hypothetical protein